MPQHCYCYFINLYTSNKLQSSQRMARTVDICCWMIMMLNQLCLTNCCRIIKLLTPFRKCRRQLTVSDVLSLWRSSNRSFTLPRRLIVAEKPCVVMAARHLCWPPAILFYRCSFDLLFSPPNIWGRLADRHKTLPHVRWRPRFIKFRQKFG